MSLDESDHDLAGDCVNGVVDKIRECGFQTMVTTEALKGMRIWWKAYRPTSRNVYTPCGHPVPIRQPSHSGNTPMS
jgi:hypothetical protein